MIAGATIINGMLTLLWEQVVIRIWGKSEMIKKREMVKFNKTQQE